MKKTISINIAGTIFYIEEDGYDKLRQYLSAVHKYFSAFADSAEIVADIENRIAEKFLIKQKQENKQAISEGDVDELIKAMGSVSDFEAAESDEDLLVESLHASRSSSGTGEAGGVSGPRGRFYRDLKRKIVGGVAAGIAHYYALDPLWVRLALILATFGMVPLSGMMDLRMEENLAILSGGLILAYIAMWIAFPGSKTLEDNTRVKKFYRDPQNKVLGGVAAGLASYLNVDMGLIRFIWVISIFFFGTGALAYIILWAIAPAAKTLTEKMEMQGEPITLFNIDSNIKRNLEEAGSGRNKEIRSLLLLPFTILGRVLSGLGRVFRELGPVIRVLAGFLMAGSAAASLLGMLIFGAALLGLANMPDFGAFPAEFLVLKDMPGSLIFCMFAITIIPMLLVLFLGLMLLLNRRVVGSTVWIALAGLFIFSLVGTVSSGIVFMRNFAETGEYTQQERYEVSKGILTLDGEDVHYGNNKRVDVDVTVKGSTGEGVLLKEIYYADGPTKSEARELASEIVYVVEKEDSVVTFWDGPLRSQTLPFRNQHIEITLEIPYRKPFAMTRAFFFGKLDRNSSNTASLKGMDLRHKELDWNKLRWAVIPDSGLVCLNFPERFIKHEGERSGDYRQDTDDFEGVDIGERGPFVKQFAVSDFRDIDLGGAYRVLIKKGESVKVTIDGEESDVDALDVRVENGTLMVEPTDKLKMLDSEIRLVIAAPDLRSVALSGASLVRVEGFDRLENLSFKLSGATLADLNVPEINSLDLELSGASKLVLRSNVNNLKGALTGSCLLNAKRTTIKKAEVSASGISRALLGTVLKLDKQEGGQSRVSVQGE